MGIWPIVIYGSWFMVHDEWLMAMMVHGSSTSEAAKPITRLRVNGYDAR